MQGLPVGVEQIVDVPQDEIQPASKENNLVVPGMISLPLLAAAALLFRRYRAQ
jgi:hypothetical protein